MRIYSLILFALLSLASCKKNEDDVPIAPVIAFKSISATEVEEFSASLNVTFTFEDNQGDIGYSDNDTYSLRVKDARLDEFDWYHIPPMTPDLQALHIKGEYTVQLNSLFMLGNGASESTTFTIQLMDRAGNWSNQITTPSVLITEVP
ncbi:MAG: hypothetical protein SGI87_09195 [Flavobacteriales bacterium]|nr:hypothetical protein [Flavobacteriales bacterium]